MKHHVKISVLTSLYRCEQFLEGYFKYLSEINGTDKMEVLLLHNDPQECEMEIINHRLPAMPFIRHITIPGRESLYRTWNRGISMSEGEYITVWNVDDVRFPNSILQQAEALDRNPEAAIAYGDIWVSKNYGKCTGFCTNSPANNHNKDFFKQYHISCFQMWRKSIHETIGYYDEQFKCVADFDFQIRAALHYLFVKTDEPLGIYLEEHPHKLSANGLQLIEHNIIAMRYANYRYLNLFLLPTTNRKYHRKQLLFFDKWQDFTEKMPFSRVSLILSAVCAGFSSCYWLCRQIAKKFIKLFFYSKHKLFD